MGRRRSVIGSTRWCHICGLSIPSNIVSSDHPLFGTIDHFIPLSLGGRDILHNRRPAHRYCNNRKGSNTSAFSLESLCSMQGVIIYYLKRTGNQHEATDQKLRQARERIALDHPTREQRAEYSRSQSWAVHAWEGEGGAVHS